ncbi:NepR family anti-sigma factor [Tropicimonas sp. S265A]
MNKQIDENLKRAYDATVSEELPDRFKDLIAKLKAKDEAPKDDS